MLNNKYLDMKIVSPGTSTVDSEGKEVVEFIITSLTPNDKCYNTFNKKEKVTQRQLSEAIDTILAKCIQENIARIWVDLNERSVPKRRKKPLTKKDQEMLIKEHEIMKNYICNKGLWNDFLNDEDFVDYLNDDYYTDE